MPIQPKTGKRYMPTFDNILRHLFNGARWRRPCRDLAACPRGPGPRAKERSPRAELQGREHGGRLRRRPAQAEGALLKPAKREPFLASLFPNTIFPLAHLLIHSTAENFASPCSATPERGHSFPDGELAAKGRREQSRGGRTVLRNCFFFLFPLFRAGSAST